MALTTERTTFTLDVLGRYVANTFPEARNSTDKQVRADARLFDTIVIGGGTFGSVLASHWFHRDLAHRHRILVLEAGPLALPEHQQNLPKLNTDEVWGIPWNSDSPQPWNREFPGLAFCLGGRSLFWGGWSPRFLDSELPVPPWPQSVVDDLTKPVVPDATGKLESYTEQAEHQLGTDVTNDFVDGVLHTELRQRLFAKLKARPGGSKTLLTGKQGSLAAETDLEAPLAVQSAPPRGGFFPFNKFSALPLLVRAARLAQDQSGGDDFRKRLMVVDNAHVIKLVREGRRIVKIVTNQGEIDVPENGRVFLALGTIENTRVALNTLPNARGLIGRNLMAHLRSNVTIRVPRATFAKLDPAKHPELQISALFVKGIHEHEDKKLGHFHIQITASGLGALGTDSEAELFKKVPDLDGLEQLRPQTDQYVVITLRGIGEMVGNKTSPDPTNRINLGGTQGPFDYGMARAQVRLEGQHDDGKDMALWEAMDRATDEIALMIADGGPIEYLSRQQNGFWQSTPPTTENRRDKLSSTHHEGGTLWMGDDETTSVTDPWGRFWEADNLYAVGPALLPTLGSPNPMLSGVALVRRTVDHLTPPPPAPAIEPGFQSLFDGTEKTFRLWQFAGKGNVILNEGTMEAQPGSDLGLFYYAAKTFGDFTLKLEFRLYAANEDNSGVLIRFRDPRKPVPDRNDPSKSYLYDNQAYVADDTGFEVQIDEIARGNPKKGIPDGSDQSRTGAIYAIPIGSGPGRQQYQRGPLLKSGDWNTYEIEVRKTPQGDRYRVHLNGQLTTEFVNNDPFRGKSKSVDPDSGYIGLQTHTGRVAFRNIRIKPA